MNQPKTADMSFHDPDHKFEKSFWGNCVNTIYEEIKQLEYARLMSLDMLNGFRIDVRRKNILDIGGGPTSLLLKGVNLGELCMVADPIAYPFWTTQRYAEANIKNVIVNGEEILSRFPVLAYRFDEVWIYNVLQHCVDPQEIIANAKACAPVLRMFEWLDFEPHPGHPHMLKQELLDEWIGGKGFVTHMNANGCYGTAYYGVFKS